jgi:hypothetical protein
MLLKIGGHRRWSVCFRGKATLFRFQFQIQLDAIFTIKLKYVGTNVTNQTVN